MLAAFVSKPAPKDPLSARGLFTPDGHTRIAQGDQLLVVTTEEVRDATERRIRAVDRAGRYARWKGEAGA